MHWLLLSLAINIGVHWLWFFTLTPLTHADAIFISPQTFTEYITFSLWQSNTNIGGYDLVPSFYPFNLFAGLLAQYGASTELIQRIIFFWPIVIFGSLTSYFLAYHLTRHRPGSFVASIVFNFNTLFLISASGHITLAVAYTFFPLVLLFYHKFLQKPSYSYVWIISLILFACSFWEFRAFYVLTIVILLRYIFVVITHRSKVNIAKISIGFFVPIFLVILLNIYWILPIVLDTQKEVLAIVAGRVLFKGGTENANMLVSAYTLFHLMWSGGEIIPFSVNAIPFYFFIIPACVFSTLILYKKNLEVIFYAVLALFGILLSKFFFPPFGGLYEVMFKYFPGFSAFREPSKFTVIVYLSYSVLIAFFIKYIFSTVQSKFQKYASMGLLVLIFLANTLPIITTDAGTLYEPRTKPVDYVLLNKFIESQPQYFRTLWIPRDSKWGIFTNNHPKINAINLYEVKYMLPSKPATLQNLISGSVATFLSEESMNTLNSLSVKYVVIPLRDTINDDDFFADFGPREYFLKAAENNSKLKRINIGTTEVAIFENSTWHDHIYMDNHEALNYKMMSPYHYQIHLPATTKNKTIYFSEAFHPGWSIILDNNVSFLNGLAKLLFQSKNGNYIDAEKAQYGLTKFTITHVKGEKIPDTVNLFFLPQILSIAGGVISISTLIFIVTMIFLSAAKRK